MTANRTIYLVLNKINKYANNASAIIKSKLKSNNKIVYQNGSLTSGNKKVQHMMQTYNRAK